MQTAAKSGGLSLDNAPRPPYIFAAQVPVLLDVMFAASITVALIAEALR